MLGQRQSLSLQQKLSPQQLQLMKTLALELDPMHMRVCGGDDITLYSQEGGIIDETGEDGPSEDADFDFNKVKQRSSWEEDNDRFNQ